MFSDKIIGFRGLGCLPESGCVSETKISWGASADKGQSQKQTRQHNNCPDGKLELILNSLVLFFFLKCQLFGHNGLEIVEFPAASRHCPRSLLSTRFFGDKQCREKVSSNRK